MVALICDPFQPDLTSRIFAVPTEARAAGLALGRLLAAWGVETVEASDSRPARLLLPDGRTAHILPAKTLSPDPSCALVVRSGVAPMTVYLLADERAAAALAEELRQNGQTSYASPLEQVPSDAPDDAPTLRLATPRSDRVVSLAELAISIGAGPMVRTFGDEFCPRCQDQPLSRDPAQDARDEAGRRICPACAHFTGRRSSP